MKIAFVGSREFCNQNFVEQKVTEYIYSDWVDYVHEVKHELVSGGARGVDSWAESIGRKIETICWIFPADWIKYGKKAGFLRNEEIVRVADHIVAFWDGQSKGTKHTIDLAIKAGKPVDVYIRKSIKEDFKLKEINTGP